MQKNPRIDGLDDYDIEKILNYKDKIYKKDSINSDEVSNQNGIYRFIINLLTQIDMDEKEAKEHYNKILAHKDTLSAKMKRDVGIRVAILDYFLNLIKILKNPKIIEIDFFEQILKLTKEDPKTGCFNSNFIAEMADKELKRAKRYKQNFSLILIDIDDFKSLNDNFGHLFGDKVLKEFSKILIESVRKEDIIGRFGGDEFVLLLPQTGRVGARFLAERIKESLENKLKNDKYLGADIPVTFSAGIATYPMDSKDYEGLIKKADSLLYKSKYLGKNRVHDKLEEDLLKEETTENKNISCFERRNCYRLPVKDDIEVELHRAKEPFLVNGKVLDISPRGLLLECSCSIDDLLLKKSPDMQINRIGEISIEKMNIKANVAHLKKEDKNLKFYIGLEFSRSLESGQWDFIEKFMHLR